MPTKAALLFAAAALIATPALAQSYPPAPPAPPAPAAIPAPPAPPAPPMAWERDHFTGVTWNANDGWSEKSRAKFEEQMKRLDEKLARLDVRLKTEEAVREVKIKALIARAESEARYASASIAKAELSPEHIRAITERAMAQAEAGERAEQAAERVIEAIQPRLDALSRRLDERDSEDARPAN